MPRVKAVEATSIDTAGFRRVAFLVEGPFGEISYIVERRHLPPSRGRAGRIEWTLVDGPFREMRGAWEIAADGAGTAVTYRSLVRPNRWTPGFLARSFARREVRAMFDALRARLRSP